MPSPPTGLLSINQSTRTITIETNDSNDTGIYTIHVIALTEDGQNTGGSSISFLLEVLHDCTTDTLTIIEGVSGFQSLT